MVNTLRSSAIVFFVLTLITGVVYPAFVTLVAQGVFPRQANGSLVHETTGDDEPATINIRDWWGADDNAGKAPKAIGSELIGQPFTGERYFWSRPSATGPIAYNGAASTGSNYGPTNPSLLGAVKQRVETLRSAGGDQRSPVPIDLVTASGSGLDPHITPAAADYQVPRIALARGLGEYVVRRVIAENVEGRTLGLLGEPRINVLRLNLALDQVEGQEGEGQ